MMTLNNAKDVDALARYLVRNVDTADTSRVTHARARQALSRLANDAFLLLSVRLSPEAVEVEWKEGQPPPGWVPPLAGEPESDVPVNRMERIGVALACVRTLESALAGVDARASVAVFFLRVALAGVKDPPLGPHVSPYRPELEAERWRRWGVSVSEVRTNPLMRTMFEGLGERGAAEALYASFWLKEELEAAGVPDVANGQAVWLLGQTLGFGQADPWLVARTLLDTSAP